MIDYGGGGRGDSGRLCHHLVKMEGEHLLTERPVLEKIGIGDLR